MTGPEADNPIGAPKSLTQINRAARASPLQRQPDPADHQDDARDAVHHAHPCLREQVAGAAGEDGVDRVGAGGDRIAENQGGEQEKAVRGHGLGVLGLSGNFHGQLEKWADFGVDRGRGGICVGSLFSDPYDSQVCAAMRLQRKS